MIPPFLPFLLGEPLFTGIEPREGKSIVPPVTLPFGVPFEATGGLKMKTGGRREG